MDLDDIAEFSEIDRADVFKVGPSGCQSHYLSYIRALRRKTIQCGMVEIIELLQSYRAC